LRGETAIRRLDFSPPPNGRGCGEPDSRGWAYSQPPNAEKPPPSSLWLRRRNWIAIVNSDADEIEDDLKAVFHHPLYN